MDEPKKSMIQDRNRFRTYEDFLEGIKEERGNNRYNTLVIQYAILFRRWEEVKDFAEKNPEYGWSTKALKPRLEVDSDRILWEENDTFSICKLLRFNEDKITAYSETMEIGKEDTLRRGIDKILSNIGKEGEEISPLFTYDERITSKGESLFEVFFPRCAPLLGVKRYEQQILPSKQVWNNKCSLVMDEVGIGKTISALYAISLTIEEAISEEREAKILIVCPSNLRIKWEEDIRDNLGRYCYKLNRDEQNEDCFQGEWKRAFFHEKEQSIFLVDNIGCSGEENNIRIWSGPDILWDLIIIDEGHLCPNNYNDLQGRRVMMLSATPVVQYMEKNSGGGRYD